MYPSKGALPTVVTSVAHAPYGGLRTLTYGNGLLLTRTYNADYELTSVKTAPSMGTALLNESFGWQADGRIASVTDNLTPTMGPTSRTASYAYSPTGRVISTAGPWGTWTFGFDAKANDFARLISADDEIARHYPRTVW